MACGRGLPLEAGVLVAGGVAVSEEAAEQTYLQFEKYVQSDWAVKIIAAAVILAITAVLTHLLTSLIRRVINHEDSILPANSIFLNIVRLVMWALGLSFMLSFCFDVNVNALITALGVGGIALSLGMQDTISNLIGGVNVSVSGLVKPGDHIKLGTGFQGIVHDVTLRQTVIEDSVKNQIIVPNSSMNTSTVTKLQPVTHIVVPIVVRAEDERLTAVAHRMEKAVFLAVGRVSKMKRPPAASFTEITEYGYRGSMVFDIADPDKVNAAIDAAVRAMALYAHGNVGNVASGQSGVALASEPAPTPESESEPAFVPASAPAPAPAASASASAFSAAEHG